MNHKFMHEKPYFSNQECVTLLACNTIPRSLNWTIGNFQVSNPTPKSISIGCHCFAFSNHLFLPSTLYFFTTNQAHENPWPFSFRFLLFSLIVIPHFKRVDALIYIITILGLGCLLLRFFLLSSPFQSKFMPPFLFEHGHHVNQMVQMWRFHPYCLFAVIAFMFD